MPLRKKPEKRLPGRPKKQKSKGGRPTVMTDEVLLKLEQAYAVGATDIEACFFAEISTKTLYVYQEKNPEFVQRKVALKSNLKFIAKNVLAESIRRDRNSGDAKWLLERRDPDYMPKQKQDHTSSDGSMTPSKIERHVIDPSDKNA